MITLIATVLVLVVVVGALAHERRAHARELVLLEARWTGRLVKCDEILATAERAEQHTHEGLVEIARCHDRMQDLLLSMERVLTDPRVHQALR